MFHTDLKLLRSFVAVASECSVTRAAERLNLTQPTVSGQLKELEQSLGFTLFHRTTRSISLNANGERLLPLAQAVLQRTEEFRFEVEEMQMAKKTQFRLGAALYTLDFEDRFELLEAFGAAVPELHYVMDNRMQSDQIPDLLDERLDVSLLLGIAVQPSSEDQLARIIGRGGIVNESQYPSTLERVVLRRRPIGLLVPVDSPLAEYDIIPQQALAGQRVAMLSVEHGEALINPITNFLLNLNALPLTLAEGNAFAVERYAALHNTCALGVGWFATVPGLKQLPVEGMNFYVDFSVVLGNGANRPARQFFEFARQWQGSREAIGKPDTEDLTHSSRSGGSPFPISSEHRTAAA